jgi:hypothetical protein
LEVIFTPPAALAHQPVLFPGQLFSSLYEVMKHDPY